jgi:selenocysteine-specific elongation factor
MGATSRGPAVVAEPATTPTSRVLATAGHVDHGKSTLAEWLTGKNPDRLDEERRRGLTIDLGFVSTVLESGIEVGIVDVPGHIRFLKNMVAGVGAVDACLFVVAATESWKPQSEDHLRILDVVGVSHGLIALTHAGQVDAARVASVRGEITSRVTGTFLESAPVVAVDVYAEIGTDGRDGLRAALTALVRRVPAAADTGRPRLWVDRSFAIRGAGAVVTGTLAGGAIAVGDHMEVSPVGSAKPVPVRVRGLETYGRRVAAADPGRRLAVNLAGTDHRSVTRGAALVRPGQWHHCTVADATLTVVPGLGHPVSRRGAFLAHIGTSEQAVRLRVLGSPGSIEPGETGTVRVRLSSGLPLVPGDRYVLRDAGRREVVGGGALLDVAPVLPVRRARPTRDVARVVAERGWIEPAELERLTGVPSSPTLGRWVVDPRALEAARTALVERVQRAGPAGLDRSLLDDRERAVAATVHELSATHGILRLAGADAAATERPSSDDDLLDHPFLLALRRSPFEPPPADGVDRNDLRRLVRSGLVVETGGVWFAASAVEEAALRVAGLLAGSPDGVRVSDVRDARPARGWTQTARFAARGDAGMTQDAAVKLTEWTTCGGCAAKWGAGPLTAILVSLAAGARGGTLLVGLDGFDDAAVLALDEHTALVSTTDFFPPMVDDPADFGAIAAANACSDVFAMGGRVVLALNIAAFPERLPAEVIASVVTAAAAVVAEAGGVVAGGHTIRSEEPIFGLAVQGLVPRDRILTKGRALPGQTVVLSKPLGTGIVLQGGSEDARDAAIAGMRRLNREASEALQALSSRVGAVTDVTGYGLCGHGWEVADRSGVTLRFESTALPLYPGAEETAASGVRTGGDRRNREHLAGRVTSSASIELEAIAYDPQTSGGLLATVDPDVVADLRGSGFVPVGDVADGPPHVVLR